MKFFGASLLNSPAFIAAAVVMACVGIGILCYLKIKK